MKVFKEIKKTALLNNMIFLFVGFIMFIIPSFISNFICYIIGGLILLFGIKYIINYINIKKRNNLSSVMLFLGVLALILGITILLKPNTFSSIIPFIIGIYIIIVSLTKINEAMNLKNNNYDKWYSFMLPAVLLFLVGVVITFNPFETITLVIRLVGVIFVVNSLYDLYNVYNYEKGFKDLKKDFEKILKWDKIFLSYFCLKKF